MKGILKLLLRTVGVSLIKKIIAILFQIVREKIATMKKRDHAAIINAALPLLEAELNEEVPKEIAKRL